jgi:hypothetical protein
LTAQSVQYVFLGYSLEHKGYRCYDPSARRIRFSRDVTFNEDQPFFFNSSTPSSSSTSLESTSFLSLPPIFTSDESVSDQPQQDTPSSPVPHSPIDSQSTHSSSIPPDPHHIEPFPLYYSRRPKVSYDIQSPIPSSLAHLTSTTEPCTDDSSQTNRYALRDRSSLELPNRYRNEFRVGAACEPNSYQEAAMVPEWQLAMSEELAALEATRTWDMVPLPPQSVTITCKWVYKVKTRSDGSVDRYKAILVARGFQ